jgi:hypothetical protein
VAGVCERLGHDFPIDIYKFLFNFLSLIVIYLRTRPHTNKEIMACVYCNGTLTLLKLLFGALMLPIAALHQW